MKKKILFIVLFLSLFLIVDNVFAFDGGLILTESEDGLSYVTCGTGANAVRGIPAAIPKLVSLFVTLLQIITPIILIITGMIEMTKSVSSGNPDNISKSKAKLVKKFIAALFVFFVIGFVTTALRIVGGSSERATFISCMSCYLNNECTVDSEYNEEMNNNDDELENKQKSCADYNYTECPEKAENGDTCSIQNQACVNNSTQSCASFMFEENCPKKAPNGEKCKWNGNACKSYTIPDRDLIK